MAVQTQIQVRRGTASSWTSTNPTLAAGELGFETDTGKFKIGTGSATWTSLTYAGGGQNTLTTYQYTATSGQTTFSGADSNGNTLSYTVGNIQVYLNGVLLVNTADYTATNGTSVVLGTGAVTDDSLTVISLGSFTVSSDIPKSTLTAKGSIVTATAGSTPANLSVGADGTVLTADSAEASGLKWATPSSGGMTLISTTTLSGSSVTLSSIPTTYNKLYVVLTGATWGTDTDTIFFQPNNLTTNYGIVTRNKNGTTSNDSLANEAITQRENILRTSVNNVHILEIQNYASASYFKAFRYYGYFEYSTTLPMAFTVAGGIRTNSAITSLVIKTSNGYTFSAGQVLLYGEK